MSKLSYIGTQIAAQTKSVYNNLRSMPACAERTELLNQFLGYAEELKPLRKQKEQTNTRLEYTYRDAGNWKTFNYVILKGAMTEEMFSEMKACCEDGHELFVPEQLGLPLIRDWDTTLDDHPYCELDEFEVVPDEPTVSMTVNDLLERFRAAKDNWRPDDYEPVLEGGEE